MRTKLTEKEKVIKRRKYQKEYWASGKGKLARDKRNKLKKEKDLAAGITPKKRGRQFGSKNKKTILEASIKINDALVETARKKKILERQKLEFERDLKESLGDDFG